VKLARKLVFCAAEKSSVELPTMATKGLYRLHPIYAEFLIENWKIRLKDPVFKNYSCFKPSGIWLW